MILKKLITITGKSGSGKTTLVKMLNEYYGIKQIQNFTSRPKRGEKDNDYMFFTKEELFEKWINNELIEAVNYNGNIYGIPVPQQEIAICILEPTGLAQAIKFCYENNIEMLKIYLDIDEEERKNRLLKRGDKVEEINKRMLIDGYMDKFKNIFDFVVNVNDTKENNLQKLINIINLFLKK